MSVTLKKTAFLGLASVLGLALGASCGGDDSKCSKIGCHDQYFITFVHDDWAEGTYRVDLTIDGEAVLCGFTIPLPDDAFAFCPKDHDVEFWAYRADLEQVFLPRGVIVVGAPDEVEITVTLLDEGEAQKGEELVTASFQVGDDRDYPNGPECDNGCLLENDDLVFEPSAGGAGGGGGGGGAASE